MSDGIGSKVEALLEGGLDDIRNHDGTLNKFPVTLKDSARKGPLGLQGLHGKAQAPVWYRNLRIKPLE
jgi:hypothetical protein